VGFLHKLRDRCLTGDFASKLEERLRDLPKLADARLRAESKVKIILDRTAFAQRYASCILRLEQLTPHQKEKVQELFDADEDRSLHIKAAAGTGKTFVAMIFLLEKVRMRKTHDVFCGPFYTQNDASFCQDRLGTNIYR